MSEFISHECGIALVRLKKPLAYYQEKYGTPLWGFYQLFLLMEKQHNRGQDGAGVACVKFDVPAGEPYMFRERNVDTNPLDKIFQALLARYNGLVGDGAIHPEFPETAKNKFDFCGELYLGHLRYGTSGGYNLSACHPFFRRSSWPTRNLMLAGNFNLTNTAELNDSLIAIGQHPIFASDTQVVLEKIGFFLDEEHEDIYRYLRTREMDGAELSRRISEDLDVARVLTRASQKWDGGYAIAGLIVELRRGAAKLHRREDLALQTVGGILGDVVTPAAQHLGVLDRVGVQEMVDLDRDGLGLGLGCEHAAHQACSQSCRFQNTIHRYTLGIERMCHDFTLDPGQGRSGFPLESPLGLTLNMAKLILYWHHF